MQSRPRAFYTPISVSNAGHYYYIFLPAFEHKCFKNAATVGLLVLLTEVAKYCGAKLAIPQ